METFIVKEGEEKSRIDSYLSKKDDKYSRVTIQRLIEEEKILVNGKKTKKDYKIQKDDEITIEKEEPKPSKLKPQNIPIEIIYEDKDIIVVNKAKGMVVHPAVRKFRWNFSKCNYGPLQRKLIWNWRRNKTWNSSQTR